MRIIFCPPSCLVCFLACADIVSRLTRRCNSAKKESRHVTVTTIAVANLVPDLRSPDLLDGFHPVGTNSATAGVCPAGTSQSLELVQLECGESRVKFRSQLLLHRVGQGEGFSGVHTDIISGLR